LKNQEILLRESKERLKQLGELLKSLESENKVLKGALFVVAIVAIIELVILFLKG
jgi:cell shape-determining protein MreC